MGSHNLFAATNPLKLFFVAAIPGAISMLASALYQTIDGVFEGRFLGATEFAALNLAMPFVIINFALADLIGVGSAVPISVSLGRKQEKEANNIFTCACLMIFIAGAIVGAILFASAPLLMKIMGADGAFAQFAVQYLRVYALISVATALVFPVILIGVFWPLGLTGIWLNFAGTAVLAAVLAVIVLMKFKKELMQPDMG